MLDVSSTLYLSSQPYGITKLNNLPNITVNLMEKNCKQQTHLGLIPQPILFFPPEATIEHT